MKFYITTIIAVLQYGFCFAQTNFDKKWISGGAYNFITEFNGTQTTNSFVNASPYKYFIDGHSNICDSGGNVILCSDGYNIYDSTLNFIENGDTLVPLLEYINYFGFSPFSQNSIFLPFDSSIYYLVTPAMTDSHYQIYVQSSDPNLQSQACYDLLLYHKIDMKANGGAGKVVEKAVQLLSNVRTDRVRMMACKHANGKDWWLLKQATDTNMIYKFLFKQDTIEGPFIQAFSEPHFGLQHLWANNQGQSVFTRDGTKYATCAANVRQVFLSDFDRCTGILSNPIVLNVPIDSIGTNYEDKLNLGLAFSANGSFLYVIKGSNIWQYELGQPDSALAWYRVANGMTALPNFQLNSASYIGPNGKIYIGNWNGLGDNMSVIDNPDIKGAGCNFCAQCLVFPHAGASSPPCMPNYDLGALNPCWPLDVNKSEKEGELLTIYPNPTGIGVFNVEFLVLSQRDVELELYTLMGQKVLSQQVKRGTLRAEVDVRGLADGVYFLRVDNYVRKVVVE
ncbi:MAG: T9SS type A sorting domain-containing protein [Chitinophagaceae bacterium]|nr:T9SS type A sorting domain-containing protein [Chitinophagaceae bacterium]